MRDPSAPSLLLLLPLPLSLSQSNVSHILICVYLQSVICGIYLVVNSHPLTGCLSPELLFWGDLVGLKGLRFLCVH